ncbi:general substrate transporter [Basidiobolus meristosporus CBS 931.73]|uniref:General substrate transporter n=1 Tax=Basidiobolus meristosporus CBS 931.73 TaxID=1314790 RepID=A0A1Y1XYB4_9FUNG|nr:general substrate transporter [Basidiobolus meristosporus CBS 931.73]|eukprot:ORX90354.1 general substrate transporter [Basidiobolus meristosporus CBS 931.73]
MTNPASNEKKSSRDSTYPVYTLFCVLTACIVRFNSGYNTSSTNISADSIHNCSDADKKLHGIFPYCFAMNSWLWGFAVGSHACGAVFGSLLGGYAQERLGRRLAMLANNCFFVLGGILLFCSINTGMWICGRFFIGFGCGYGTVVAPTYIGEIAPIKTRGTFGAFNQFCTTMGILVVECMSLGMSTPIGWRILVALPGAFSLVQTALIPLCSETPRYHVSRNRFDEAKAVLLKLRDNSDIESEYRDIVTARKALQNRAKNLGINELLKNSSCRRKFFVCVGISMLKQWSGINGIMYYSTAIFTDIYGDSAKYVTICVGGLNVVMTMVSAMLVDRAGRKMLLLISSGGASLFCILTCIGIQVHCNGLTVASIMVFVTSFAFGLGSIPSILITETMPSNAVSITSTVAQTMNWVSCFLIGLIFPTLFSGMRGYVFLIFAGFNGVGCLAIFLFVKETKGKSIEELTARLK